MERGYRQIVRRYPNSKIRLTKTSYPYGTKFHGLFSLILFIFSLILHIFSLMLFISNFTLFISVLTYSSHLYSVVSFAFSRILFAFSHISLVLSHILYVFSLILYVFSLILFLFSLLFLYSVSHTVREDIVPQILSCSKFRKHQEIKKTPNTEIQNIHKIENNIVEKTKNMEKDTRITLFLILNTLLMASLNFTQILLVNQGYLESQKIRRIIHVGPELMKLHLMKMK